MAPQIEFRVIFQGLHFDVKKWAGVKTLGVFSKSARLTKILATSHTADKNRWNQPNNLHRRGGDFSVHVLKCHSDEWLRSYMHTYPRTYLPSM